MWKYNIMYGSLPACSACQLKFGILPNSSGAPPGYTNTIILTKWIVISEGCSNRYDQRDQLNSRRPLPMDRQDQRTDTDTSDKELHSDTHNKNKCWTQKHKGI